MRPVLGTLAGAWALERVLVLVAAHREVGLAILTGPQRDPVGVVALAAALALHLVLAFWVPVVLAGATVWWLAGRPAIVRVGHDRGSDAGVDLGGGADGGLRREVVGVRRVRS